MRGAVDMHGHTRSQGQGGSRGRQGPAPRKGAGAAGRDQQGEWGEWQTELITVQAETAPPGLEHGGRLLSAALGDGAMNTLEEQPARIKLNEMH